ncbi:hypothetical protein Golomagni_00585 [Golovinomyces magnicellulatus]|nr:hypothetical protein Golomagni_00585 [Golovinomyces magnicellulatus]
MAILINLLSTLQSDVTNASATQFPTINSDAYSTKFKTNSNEKILRSKSHQEKFEIGAVINENRMRRELFIKGREGSRRRKRYENGIYLLENPFLSFFSVKIHTHFSICVECYCDLLYFKMEIIVTNLTPCVFHPLSKLPKCTKLSTASPFRLGSASDLSAYLWERRFQRQLEEEEEESQSRSESKLSCPHGKASRDLKLALKKAKGAKPILKDIENEIRAFIQNASDKDMVINSTSSSQSLEIIDSEDEDIIFISRDKDERGTITMSDEIYEEACVQRRQKMDSLVFYGKSCQRGDQDTGRFVRWLIHEAAEYYGLESRSENTDENRGREDERSARKIIVSFRNGSYNKYQKDVTTASDDSLKMPRPLWCLI